MTLILPNPRMTIWFVPGLVLLSGLQTGWTSRSESEVRQMEVTRGSNRLAEGPPSTLLLYGQALASTVRQSSFFPGVQFHEWWNLLSGENWFLWLRNLAMTVSICDIGVRDAGSGFAAHLLGNLGQVASPLQASVASSALLLVVWWLNETMYATPLAQGLHRVTAE